MGDRIKTSIAIMILGFISIALWFVSLKVEHNALKVIGLMLGLFAVILNMDEKRNGNRNPLVIIGVFLGSIGAALMVIGLVQSFT